MICLLSSYELVSRMHVPPITQPAIMHCMLCTSYVFIFTNELLGGRPWPALASLLLPPEYSWHAGCFLHLPMANYSYTHVHPLGGTLSPLVESTGSRKA